jgi:hypothetical protein
MRRCLDRSYNLCDLWAHHQNLSAAQSLDRIQLLHILSICLSNNRVIKINLVDLYDLLYKLRIISLLKYLYIPFPKILYREFLRTINFFNILNINAIISIY